MKTQWEPHLGKQYTKTLNGKFDVCIIGSEEHFNKDNIQSDQLNTDVHLYYSAAVSVLSFISPISTKAFMRYIQMHRNNFQAIVLSQTNA